MEKDNSQRKALGRGLAALLGETVEEENAGSPPSPAPVPNQVIKSKNPATLSNVEAPIIERTPTLANVYLSISQVRPNPDQPRKNFDQVKLNELAESIKEQGVVQPIVVKKIAENEYQIVAGERRWRASQIAGLSRVPAFVRESTRPSIENDLASIIENIQREDLNSLELAQSYERLMRIHFFTQDTLAKKLGISRASVANTVRLLKLPAKIQGLVVTGELSEGHCRALLSLSDETQIFSLSEKICSEKLSVRETEFLAKEMFAEKNFSKIVESSRDGEFSESVDEDLRWNAIKEELREIFGTKVGIRGSLKKGSIEIYYSGEDSMNRVLHLLRASKA